MLYTIPDLKERQVFSMECRFCHNEMNEIVVLPFRPSEDLGLSPYACIPCATEHGYYCPIHSRAFIGSTCDHPFCISCIDAEVRLRIDEAEDMARRIKESMTPSDWAELGEAAEIPAMAMGTTKAVAVLRFVVTLAHRKRIGFDEAVIMATSENAIEELFPTATC